MSYWCNATNAVVKNEPCALVPSKVRRVIYIGQTKPDPRSEYLQFASQSEGWEIAEEVKVRQSKAEEYAKTYPPQVIGDKEVRFLKPRKPKEKYVKKSEDDTDDKPED